MEPVPPLPLSTLLSQVLVAHTVELDNEAEHRLPHRTTRHDDPGARHDAPWLVSFVLWANVLQYLDEDPVTVSELRARARTTRLLLGGLRRWGYVTLTPPPARRCRTRPRTVPWSAPRGGAVGRRRSVRALPPLIDDRWRMRFGAGAIDHLERALRAVFDELTIDPPAYLPVVHPAQNGKAEPALPEPPARALPASTDGAGLSPLLAGVLLAFTLDFERESRGLPPDQCQHAARAGPDRRTRPRPAAADGRVEGGQRDVCGLAGTARLRRGASPIRP